MRKNIFDRAIELVSPAMALNRYHAKARLEVANKHFEKMVKNQERKYDGASKGRHYSDWFSPEQSVNQEVIAALTTLRNRSRELGRNNPYAINAVRAIRNNVVGTGIIPTAKGAGIGKNQLKQLKEAWNDWAGKTNCDFDDMNTFYGLESIIMKTVVESGECLIRKVRSTSADDIPLRLQILEGDYIDSSKHNGQWQPDNTMLYYGIKFAKDGKRLGYWIFRHHPNEFGAVSDFVPASDMIHVYEVERPGQMRGVPFSCGAMLRLKDLDDYEFTERIRSKVAAAFAVFITDDATSENKPGDGVDDLEKVEPGMIKHLKPGQGISVAQPPMTQGFSEFVKSNLRGISAGFGTSYETLTNDYSNVNFSSGRMGWLEFNRNVEHLQWNLLIPRFCDKVYPWFVEACQLKGIIPFGAKVKVTWTPPRREMIDPLKEIQAIKEQLRAGLCSWQDVVRMFGYIPEELTEELKQDAEMWDNLELKPTIDARFDPNRPPDQEPQDVSSEKPE
ncbi:phage portal protein [Pinibacter soli]|nr:phage portal protein [Pinibacter soli]